MGATSIRGERLPFVDNMEVQSSTAICCSFTVRKLRAIVFLRITNIRSI